MAAYSVVMQNQAIAGASTLVFIRAAATASTRASFIRIVRAWVSQETTETSEQLGIQLGQKVTAFGTYTATTPVSHALGSAASGIAGGTAGASATSGTDATAEGGGTFTPIIEDGFNNLNGWLWVPTPAEYILLTADTAVALKLVAAPTVLTGWTAGLTFEELN
jgi:hypothetical protein